MYIYTHRYICIYKYILSECNTVLSTEGFICAFSLQCGQESLLFWDLQGLIQVLLLLCLPMGPNGCTSPFL